MSLAQNAYRDASITTASPAQLLVMLCDRLVLDLTRAIDALHAADRAGAHTQLLHAQEIVLELRSSLRLEEWDGAYQLASIYDFLHLELVRANVAKDPKIAEGCLGLVTDLAATWREAALMPVAAAS